MEKNSTFVNTKEEMTSSQEEVNLYNQVFDQRKKNTNQEGLTSDIEIHGLPINKLPYSEALKKSTEYFEGDSLAAGVWVNKYALKDSAGNLYELTPDDMHWRIAREIERVEKKYPNPLEAKTIYEALRRFKFIIPQGSPMAGIGNPFQIGSLSNCFVIGNRGSADSYGGIMKVDEEQVQLMKRRGGVGHDLSHIRPKGSPVKNSALTSTGLVPFMERYSNSTREVAQDGRRGALMLSVSIKHPDAEGFIDAKLEQGKVTGANVSVKITDEFMKAVQSNDDYVQQYPVNSNEPSFVKRIKASELWEKIVHNAWHSAEPGILFWDTILRESIPDCYAGFGFQTVSTNPCGEIPLCPYDSCRLLAINLYSYVKNPFTSKASYDFQMFKQHVALAQRMMDDIIDLELEKIDRILEKIDADPESEEVKQVERNLWEKIREKCIQGRRTGIGITAEGDMLAALGYRYGSEEATNFSVEIHKTLALSAYRSSVALAAERGAFPIYDSQLESDNPFVNRIREADPDLYADMVKYGRRNIALLTIAPTGSVSILTQTTSGIEPVFMVAYKRRKKVNPNDINARVDFVDEVGDHWEEYNVFHHKFLDWLKINGYEADKVTKMKDQELNNIIRQSPYYKATANDVDWLAKVKMQGAVQKWVDHSISVTVNVPNEVTEELVGQIYMTGWQSGCKGITVYRDGSRSGVLIKDSQQSDQQEFRETSAPKRPKVLECSVVRFNNDSEKWLAVVGLLNDRPYEIFTGKADHFFLPAYVEKGWVIKNRNEKGEKRYDFQFLDLDGYKVTIEGLSRSFNKEFWNYAKLISGILRHGMPLPFVVDVIEDLSFTGDHLHTWKNGVVRALKRFIADGTQAHRKICSKCNQSSIVYLEGCPTCTTCGESKCS
ncbi:MAG TPA: adenosylcobalamin-dependent ribonucleoside-diphosphate reductase [Bacteroidales bacterium]|nr:adenosylcobalamin-dependent ribonucleoside-diphosphate reductase [Bacteroidales bacterium]